MIDVIMGKILQIRHNCFRCRLYYHSQIFKGNPSAYSLGRKGLSLILKCFELSQPFVTSYFLVHSHDILS